MKFWTVVILAAAGTVVVGFFLLQLGIYLGGAFSDRVIGR